ncbi:MAG: hypothetical protein ABSC19_20070 [Syntrophorhabdales bacterium]
MNDEDHALLLKLMDHYGIADIAEELADECGRRAQYVREASLQPLAEKWKWWEITLKQVLMDRPGVDTDSTSDFG